MDELAELGSPFTLITQDGPLQNLDGSVRALAGSVIVANSSEAAELARVLESAAPDRPVVGVGGGVVMDAAKWVGWSLALPLYLVPSSVSVDAMVTPAVGVRTGGGVQYQGFAVADRIIVDMNLVRTAPIHLNRAGIGDLLSIHTGLFDWRLGAAASVAAVDDRVAAAAASILDETIEASDEIADVSERGIAAVMAGYSDINDMCVEMGHSQMQEGSEHYFAYLAEQVTGRKFVHGELITLGMVLMSRWQDNVEAKVLNAVERSHVRWRPDDLELDRRVLEEILDRLPEFTVATNLRYSVINERPLDRSEIASLLDGLV
jgi:glycerol-1-phosphate dehydrogenase [NAD(P)+]